MSLQAGLKAEQRARDYLKAQGLKWIHSNYRCRFGEIDLIMREEKCLVFVEVRARSSCSFGGAIASVTCSKQRKLVKSAEYYLQINKLHDKQAARFDVVGFEGKGSQIEWVKNAFGLDF